MYFIAGPSFLAPHFENFSTNYHRVDLWLPILEYCRCGAYDDLCIFFSFVHLAELVRLMNGFSRSRFLALNCRLNTTECVRWFVEFSSTTTFEIGFSALVQFVAGSWQQQQQQISDYRWRRQCPSLPGFGNGCSELNTIVQYASVTCYSSLE